jgi:hypothetical protein
MLLIIANAITGYTFLFVELPICSAYGVFILMIIGKLVSEWSRCRSLAADSKLSRRRASNDLFNLQRDHAQIESALVSHWDHWAQSRKANYQDVDLGGRKPRGRL